MKRNRRLKFYNRLGFQMGVTVALVTCLSFAAVGGFLVRHERETLTRELTLRVLSEARHLALAASSPLLRHDPELGLHPLILKALDETPELEDLIVLDAEGKIAGHRDLLRVGETLQLSRPSTLLEVATREDEEAWLDGDTIVVTRHIQHLDQRVGLLVAWVEHDHIDKAVAESLRSVLTIAGLGLIFMVLLILFRVTRALKPLNALSLGVTKIGYGDLSTRVSLNSSNELGALAGLINDMASGLEKAQRDLVQKERLDHELAIARELQSSLLPSQLQTPAGYEVAAHYTAALEVSGDYYDVIPLMDGRVALMAADVSGKGVPGLVVMAMLRIALRDLSQRGTAPSDVLLAASRMLRGTMRKGMFVTCIYGVLDPSRHRFDYASAGHCPPALFGPGKAPFWLKAGGKPIGLFPEQVFEASIAEHSIEIGIEDGLLLYTDGLVEAMDAQGRQLGEERVLDHLARLTTESATVCVAGLRQRVEDHRQDYHATDDLTLVAVKRLSPTPVSEGRSAP